MAGLGGAAIHAANAGTRDTSLTHRLVSASHGIALVLVLVGGVGMLARLGLASGGVPGWIWGNLVIWVMLAALIALPSRRPQFARALFLTLPVLGFVAGLLALTKPF